VSRRPALLAIPALGVLVLILLWTVDLRAPVG
jgi:hypothetical protein